MGKISVTYNAPDNDAEVVVMGGVRFFDGQSVDIDEDQHSTLLGKLRTNQHFDVAGSNDFESPAPIEGEDKPQGFGGASQGWSN